MSMTRTYAPLLLTVLAACEISSSATDRNANEKEIVALMEQHRREDEWLHRKWSLPGYEAVRALYDARFEGEIMPGVGCEVCPDLCKDWDLRPMGAAEFQERYRESVRACDNLETYPEEEFACFEVARLSCIASAGGAPLHQAMLALTGPGEDPLIRRRAATDLLDDIDEKLGLAILRELARGVGEQADLARVTLEELDTSMADE